MQSYLEDEQHMTDWLNDLVSSAQQHDLYVLLSILGFVVSLWDLSHPS
jgi:hypothetical protein